MVRFAAVVVSVLSCAPPAAAASQGSPSVPIDPPITPSPSTDDVIVYRGELSFRGVPLDGLFDLEFRLFATETDSQPIAAPVFANDWDVDQGAVLVGLDFGTDASIPDCGAWLEITVDGATLSPRQHIAPQCWSMSGHVTRSGGRSARIVEPDASVEDDADGAAYDSPSAIDEESSSDTQPGETGRDSNAADSARRAERRMRGGASELLRTPRGGLRGGNRGDSLTGGGDDTSGGGHEHLLFAAGDRFLTATDSVYINIDSDNYNPDTRLFEIAKNRSLDVGGTSLFRLEEDGDGILLGNLDIGAGSTIGDDLHVFDQLRVDGQVEINAGVDIFGNVAIEGDLTTGAIATTGFVEREYTAGAPRCAIPIAYGSISSTGGTLSGTGNFDVAVDAIAGVYDITVDGENYSNADYTVTITPVTNSPRFTGVVDPGAAFRVNIWNLSGTLTDTAFQFTIWKTNPN